MSKGNLIVFTGIDGSGKTTQANMLVKSLEKDGITVSYVWSRWEPLFLKFLIKRWKSRAIENLDKGAKVSCNLKDRKQDLLSNPFFRWLWLISFFIDYGFQIFIKIRIKLFEKRLIISDRIFYDSVIDQAVNLVKNRDWLLDSLDSFWMKFLFPKPNMVIYIDCSEEIAFSRKNDAYVHNIEYLIDRRKLYLKLADRYEWIKIDGTLPVDEIAVRIKDIVYKRLGI